MERVYLPAAATGSAELFGGIGRKSDARFG